MRKVFCLFVILALFLAPPLASAQQLTMCGGGTGGLPTPWVETGADIYFQTGNVGIGTNAPGNELEVAGTAQCTNLTVDSAVRFSNITSCAQMSTDASGNVTCGSDADSGGDITDVQAGTGISVANSSGPAPTVSIADGGVDTTQLANSAVTLGKMAADSVDSSKIVDGSVDLTVDVTGVLPQANVDGAIARDSELHDALTIGTNTASALSLSGQQLSLGDAFVRNSGDTMTGNLEIARAGTNALLKLENSGDTNVSGINFSRERSTGTDVIGGSIFMPSDVSNTDAYLYLQAQSASASAGVTGALTPNNGVRMILRGGEGVLEIQEGNVGIGTGIPQAQLHTTGTLRFANFSSCGKLSTDADGDVVCDTDQVNDGDVTDVLAGTGISVTNSSGPQPSVAIADAGVGTTQLANGAVTSTKLANGAVDISTHTNLSGNSEIVLTGDSLSLASSVARDSELHDALTIGTNTASALSLSGQQLSLGDAFVRNSGDTMTGNLTMASGTVINHNTDQSYDKIRVWNSGSYSIGMRGGITYGGLNDYAMTFTMNQDSDRGWIFRDTGDGESNGAMSLTTTGLMTVAQDVRAPIFYDLDNTGYYLNPNSNSNLYRVYAVADMRAPIFYDRDNTSYYLNPASTSYVNQLNTAGNVNIGGTSTSHRLEVDIPGLSEPGLIVMGDDIADPAYSPSYGGNFASSEARVGIGTSSPRTFRNLTIWEDSGYGGIEIVNASASTSGAVLDFHRRPSNTASQPNGSGNVGVIRFSGYDSAGDRGAYGYISVHSDSGTAGSVRGGMSFRVAQPGNCALNCNPHALNIVGQASGNPHVGINTTSPSYDLHVVGEAAKTTGSYWTSISDRRMKNVKGEVSDGLDTVLSLRPVKWRWNEKHKELYGETPDEDNFGFIAQEIKEVIPEFVSQDEKGYYWYDPSGMEAILTSAIQELNTQLETERAENEAQKYMVEELQTENTALKKQLSDLSARLGEIENLLFEASQQHWCHPTFPPASFSRSN